LRAFQIQIGEGFEALVAGELPEPLPGPGQVLVRVHAVSLNYRDLLVVKGLSRWKSPAGRIPVSDGAGEVVAIGSEVSRIKVGDRVAGIFQQDWLSGEATPDKVQAPLGSHALDGMLVQYRALSQQGVVRIPDHLSYEEAATLPIAAVTAWNALFHTNKLKRGETVVIQGTGGVSVFALQFASLLKARAIVTSSSDDKLFRARRLGAWETINYRTTPEWHKRVLDLTDGRGTDHVVDVGGADNLNQSLEAVRLGGTVSLVGFLSGLQARINTAAIVSRNVRVLGIQVGSRDLFDEMNCAMASASLRPVVDRLFPFEQARDALRFLDRGAHFGKVCISLEHGSGE
jgi:NADPH:quinone reductase-like Zn-dependent oxidoreductase